MRSIEFAKGHGTRNDFVLFVDRNANVALSDADVAAICDRRSGIGADGILRAVDAGLMPQWSGQAGRWFMDYRNADGSIAEMCGNGLRVFLRFLAERDLIDPSGPVTVETRAGLRTGRFLPDGEIAVTMGAVTVGDTVQISVGESEWTATTASVGNPHAVVRLDSAQQLADLDLSRAPRWTPTSVLPHGVNVEFVVAEGPCNIRMRVYERGVGETESCGTGVVAAAAATTDGPETWVRVPGGTLRVDLSGDEAVLIGPAEVVAWGSYNLPAETV